MASTQHSLIKPVLPLGELGDDRVRELAMRHLAELAEGQRTAPAELHLTRAPRLRRLGRRFWDIGSKLLDVLEILWRFLINPRHIPGRWLARLRLLAPSKTFNFWLVGMTAAVVALGVLTFVVFGDLPAHGADPKKSALAAVIASVFGVTSGALLAFLWNDLFRCPHLLHRICRQVRRRPDCVLLSDIGRRAVKLAPREEPVKIVPRTELYDEITPGVLQRKRKDVQIVVGDPGAGKTTALIGVAETLAKLGIVPVLVPLRSTDDIDLVKLAKERLREQVHDYVRSDAQFEQLWRWLYQRRRVAILTDDLDRLSPDGERGFMLRKALQEVETVDLPIVVTARPAGVPAGIAASAIDLGGLDEQRAVDCVALGARKDPSFRASREVSHQSLLRWITSGRLTEVPYYLELLAQLAAAGRDAFPELPEPWTTTIAIDQQGLFEPEPDGSATWNPWWVHFLLIDHFYYEVCSGNVARWKGIEPHERACAMSALQDAALGVLLSQAVAARANVLPREEQERRRPERTTIEDFVPTNDRDDRTEDRDHRTDDGAATRRPGISAHEVIETAERLRILDRDAENEPQFRHRITQAYLAGRRLAEIEVAPERATGDAAEDWIGLLLDHRHPEKLTTHTALTFAALWADRERRERRNVEQHGQHGNGPSATDWERVGQRILRRLVDGAAESLQLLGSTALDEPSQPPATVVSLTTEEPGHSSTMSMVMPARPEEDRWSGGQDDLDPRHARDPEARRDPDDALIKLTTAADIAHAIACKPETDDEGRCPTVPEERTPPVRRAPHGEGEPITQCDVLGLVRKSSFVTRWTKLNAITAIAALEAPDRWRRIWAFARDPDYAVRQAASLALERDACAAYRALETDIEKLIMRAAALSALDQSLEKAMADGHATARRDREYDIGIWTIDDVLGLQALGTVLPAIVSGLQEDPAAARALASWQGRDGGGPDELRRQLGSMDGDRNVTPELRARYARSARQALDHLVALAFQGGHHVLERMVAQGFRGDAMRHATGDVEGAQAADRSHAGPGWVAAHARLVATVGLCQAEHWYAQLMLGQALALYTIAGASRQAGYDVLARCLHRGGAHRHAFTQRALRLARTAVRRHSVHSARWSAFIWDDEVSVSNKRPVSLTDRTGQLLGDVTVLLDLGEGAQEDRLEASAHMDELPYCLHRSRDRREILGTGCPPECGWNLCPYKQPPPDEPNEHHGVSRAFCRQQRWIARRHRPLWQRRISGRRLAAFWQEMERRARI
ncbi:MAG TPA: ATP-binding protein [Solirubrobacteraceae bacterium]|nr:ATP-binding protein [Solirubrobacteraceae bacterium]